MPTEYVLTQNFIREVRNGREKQVTTDFFEIPAPKMRSIFDRAAADDDIPFDNDQWRLERAKIKPGEKELLSLDAYE